MDIKNNIEELINSLGSSNCKLVAVSKTKPISDIKEAYDAGQRIFGENKAQEMTEKQGELPEDIQWHMIGHLQRNKVKYIAPYVSLIHSVDSLKLLKEINKQAKKNNRVIDVLLQIHIAEEDTKFGLHKNELYELLHSVELPELHHIKIVGLMGMATFTDNEDQIRREFKFLADLFNSTRSDIQVDNVELTELSMGMSGDYKIAIEEGSTMIRVGSAIFGERNYN
ncbi:YggS family pyridoxal phosphate-dependent enzyme [Fulvivirga lutea]|uniref:Pyridoxal phosphate homeostasis protein n=1 Tax=Fulvivirga lutea TaxID=2810512 RepID=A0A975A2Q4_9BACT|nr:YggS family pyridoxal phosphate-dependent enzyme [Fulvivirga lutea]QSE99086.1 YggS family pyridoxal phosphate-dependent enzyme [Fulvivirga lutea]